MDIRKVSTNVMRRLLAVLVFSLSCMSLFAYSDRWFTLSHNIVSTDAKCYLEFWKPRTSETMRSARFDEPGTYLFSTLGIYYTGNKKLTVTATISYSDLINTVSGVDMYYDYDMEILKPNTNEVLVSSVPTSQHGAATATVLNKKQFSGKKDIWSSDEVADFRITLKSASAPGTYSGTMEFTLVVN